MRERWPAVYLMASGRNETLYVGVTSDLVRRVSEHRDGGMAGFASRYGCRLLVWFEMHEGMESAIAREKQIKGLGRKAKLAFIEAAYSGWRDLYPGLLG